MKKLLLYGSPLLVVAVVGGYFAIKGKTRPASSPYGIEEQLNKPKTGSVVGWFKFNDEDWYLFVRDFKRSPNKPQFLCYMNYTSTQGSYYAYWSKDGQMIAVFNESSLHFPELKWPQWVIGYDWKKGQILHSPQIVSSFAHHGGKRNLYRGLILRDPAPREVIQFEPQKLNRLRAMP